MVDLFYKCVSEKINLSRTFYNNISTLCKILEYRIPITSSQLIYFLFSQIHSFRTRKMQLKSNKKYILAEEQKKFRKYKSGFYEVPYSILV